MISEAELIVDRRRLRRKLTLWRILAVLLAVAAIAALVAERDALLPDAQAWRNAVAMVEQAKADGYSFTSVGIPDDAARAAQEPRT